MILQPFLSNISWNREIEIMIDLLEDNNGTVCLKAMNFTHQFVSLAKILSHEIIINVKYA